MHPHWLAALEAFHLPSEDSRVVQEIAADVQVMGGIEKPVLGATGVVVAVDSVEFAGRDMLQAVLPALMVFAAP